MAADLICVQASCCSAPIRTHRVLPNWLWHALHLFWTSVRPAAAAAEEVIQFETLQTVIGLMLDLICSGRSCLFFKSSLKVGLYWAALLVYYQQWSWFIFNFSSFVFCNCFLQDKHNIWFMLFTFLYYICVCVWAHFIWLSEVSLRSRWFPRRDQVKWGSGCQQTVQTGRRADTFSVFVFLSEFNQRIIPLKHRWSCFVPLFSQDGMKYWYDVSHHFLLWYDYRYTDAKYRYFYQTVEPLWLLWRFDSTSWLVALMF